MAKIKNLISRPTYDWKYNTVGGVTRVNITTGEDIAHLEELDQKLWTVLSLPVNGLVYDAYTLKLLDIDGDGKIRANEVIAASKWLKTVLVDMNVLIDPRERFSLIQLRNDTDEGVQVLASAKLIMNELGIDGNDISIADIEKYKALYEKKFKEECEATNDAPYEPPYGDGSDAAEEALKAVRGKVADWFMRCKLVQFDGDAQKALDVQIEQIASISNENLNESLDKIASYPLARPSVDAQLPLLKGINPVWRSAISELKTKIVDLEWEGKEALSEEEWNTIVAKIDAYTEWKANGESKYSKAVAAKMAESEAAIEPVERLLYYCRDFYYLLKNYVVFATFYKASDKGTSIFQAGRLYIDQRECGLCIRVSDMGKQLSTAAQSGIYLIYCHCTAKSNGAQMDIVAALTDGDVDGLVEGKNAVFYDRNGQDYDAVVTKIIDNPISIRQAFWSPYRKFGKWVSDKITKSASEKESKQFEEMTSKADNATADLATASPEGKGKEDADKKAMPFDIAKFAGIFAAIGLAFGAIGGALATLGGFVVERWYNVLLLVAAVVLCISGPSMLLAWLKLRKRDLGPVLNANGWAINSKIRINTTFGATLTSIAKYPKVKGVDPFANKKMPWWQKCLWWLLAAIVVAFIALYFTHNLPWQKSEEPACPTDTVATTAVVADTPVENVEDTITAPTVAQ